MKETRLQLTDQFRLWENPEHPGHMFIDLTFKFTRPLTPEEKNRAIAHFANGLDRLNISKRYSIYTVDFSLSDTLQLTFEYLEADVGKELLQLTLEFRNMLPVHSPKVLIDLTELT